MRTGISLPGLTREDFEVFEDGKPQKIEMFSYVELPVERPDRFARPRPPRQHRRAIERATVRRPRVRGRARRPRHQPAAHVASSRRSAREFVEQHFGANDLAAVVYTSGRTDATQDFTSDRNLLLAAIDKFVGRRLQSAAVEALERHYHREFTRLEPAGERSRAGPQHHRYGGADQHARSRA